MQDIVILECNMTSTARIEVGMISIGVHLGKV